MTLADRIHSIAATPDYAEFARLWRRFGAGHVVDVVRLSDLGTEVHRRTLRAAAGAQTDELEDAVRTIMPELDEYVRFVARSLRPTPTVGV